MSSDPFATAEHLHRFLVDRYAVSTCLNCLHWEPQGELCKLANQRPPAETIVYGCAGWVDCPF